MGNLWFNIRIGLRHYTLTKDWVFDVQVNNYHKGNPKRFEAYTLFGRQFY